MSKITEYTTVSTIRNDDVLLIDGARGTKIITASNAATQFMNKVIGNYDYEQQDDINYKRISEIRSSVFNSAVYKEKSGPMVAFTDGASNVSLRSAKVTIAPIITGSGTPSASNIRPIVGWNKLSITRCKKNIVDMLDDGSVPSIETGQLLDGAGHRTMFIRIDPSLEYRSRFDFDSSIVTGCYILYYDENKNFIEYHELITAGLTVLSIPENAAFMMVRIDTEQSLYTGYSFSIVMTSVFDSSSDSYNGSTYTVLIPNDLDYVFYGTIDFVNGILETDYAQIQSYNGETLPGVWYSDRDVYVAGNTPTIGAQVVYQLEQPVVYEFTPVDIITLYGDNTFWSDAGNVDVSYVVDLIMYIDSKIEEAL